MSLLRKILGLKPNDWVVVWSDYASWVKETYHERCFYVIKYSKFRHKYKLCTSGYAPTKHRFYNTALTKVAELNNKIL